MKRLFYFPLLIILLASLVSGVLPLGQGVAYASPGITIDSPTTTYGEDSDSHTFSHTSTGGPTGLIVVSVCGISGDKQVSGVTYAGQPLTEAISRQYGGTSGPYVSMWYLKAPATGANDVVVTCTAADKFAIGVVSFTGVDQTTPVDGAVYAEAKGANGLEVEVTTSAVGDLVLDASAYTCSGAPTVDPSQTQQWVGEMGGGEASGMFGAGSTEAGAPTSVLMTWTAAGSGKERVVCALNINAFVPPAADISNTPDNYAFGTVAESSTSETGLTHFTVTNNSAFPVNITISGTDMTGGVTWTLSNDGTAGNMIYGLNAGLEGGSYNVIVRRDPTYETLVSGLAGSGGTQQWGLQLLAPTSFSDGASKSGIVTLTATAV